MLFLTVFLRFVTLQPYISVTYFEKKLETRNPCTFLWPKKIRDIWGDIVSLGLIIALHNNDFEYITCVLQRFKHN